MKLKQLLQLDEIPIEVRFYIIDHIGHQLAYGTINNEEIWKYQDYGIYAFDYHVDGGYCFVHLKEVTV